MDITKLCPIRSDRRVGFVVLYKKNNKEVWYHVNRLKKLIKLVGNLNKKNIKCDIYRCCSGEKMSDDMIFKVKSVGKIDRERLFLDDNQRA